MRARTRRWALFVERAVRFALGGALLVALYTLLNPFGAISAQDEHNRQTWQRLYANSYHYPKARDQITVVTLTDGDIASLQPGDPVLDSAHFARVIRNLANPGDLDKSAAGRPKAILVDVLLGDFAPEEKTVEPLLQASAECDVLREPYDASKTHLSSPFRCLVQVIAEITRYSVWKEKPECVAGTQLQRLACIRQAGGIPVLVAVPVDPQSKAAPTLSLGAQALSAVAIEAPIIVSTEHYPLVTPEAEVSLERGNITLSPAALLYAAGVDGCGSSGAQPPAGKDGATPSACPVVWHGGKNPAWSQKFRRPVDVIWGVGAQSDAHGQAWLLSPAHADQEFYDGKGTPRCAQRASGFWQAVTADFRIVFDTFERSSVPCIYAQHLNYAALLDPGNPKVAQHALAGRIVLLGLDSPQSGDYLPAGPDVARPGVFYHAMALDNLLAMGANYPKPPENLMEGVRFNQADALSAIGTFCMLLYLGAIRQVEHPSILGKPARAKRAALFRAFAIACGGFLWTICVLIVLTDRHHIWSVLLGRSPIIPDRPVYAAVALVILLSTAKIFQIAFAPILELAMKREHWIRIIFGSLHGRSGS